MKIGILTFPNSTSYGAVLQMYALYKSVEKLGAEAEIINYHNSFMKQRKHYRSLNSLSQGKRTLKNIAIRIVHSRQIVSFRDFEKKMRMYPPKPEQDISMISNVGMRYDAVICGSDQVWNAHITGGDMHFYLDFCRENTKRISYAPSFGKVAYSYGMEDQIKQELGKFSHISVREQEGQHYVEQTTGRRPELVLDPTFLLHRKEWEVLEKAYAIPQDGYIVYYAIRSSATLLNFCRELAEKENKKIVIIGGNFLKRYKNKDCRVTYAPDLSPEEWLYVIHHADYVVTNSFHGTAFSIHYQKDFYVEFSSDTNSRLEEIIQLCALEDRVIDHVNLQCSTPIDYASVECRLAQRREQSLAFLQNAIC